MHQHLPGQPATRPRATAACSLITDGCLECGTCRIICNDFSNVEWEYPRGGYGILFKFGLREISEMAKPIKHVFVCTQMRPPGHPRGSCGANGSAAVFVAFQQQFEKRGLWGRYALTGTGCIGPCGNGPSVLVYPDGVMYGAVTQGRCRRDY